MSKTSWIPTSAATTYVPREKPIQESVAPFSGKIAGAAPATTNVGTNTGQRILAADGTWIPQPSFTSGGADQLETLRPSAFTTSYSGNPPTVSNSGYAYDADTNHATTFGQWAAASEARTNNRVDIFTFNTWAAKAQTWTSATINVSRSYADLSDGESASTSGSSSKTSSVLYEYSTNNGSSWTTLGTDNQTSVPTAPQTLSASITTTPTMSNILVKVTMTRGGGGTIYEDGISLPGLTGSIDLKLFDVWIDGVYAGGAGNITCNNLTVTGDATFQNKIYDSTASSGTTGQVLKVASNGKVAWQTDAAGSGTVTSVAVSGSNGVGVSGSPITTSGTISLSLGNITPTSISTGTGAFTGDVEFSASIKSPNGSNSPVVIAPDGTGDLHVNADSIRLGDNNADSTIATNGTGDLILTTHEGSATQGIIRLYDGANGNITLTPNGTGQVQVGSDQVVTLTASQTLTNKTISGASNTLTNIGNASLTNSTISGVSLGSNLFALTISSPLTGSSYNGSSAVSIGIPAATSSVSGYLTSTDWNTFNNKGSGTVTSVSVVTANGVSGSVATATTTPAITLTLGAITPTSVASTGAVSGTTGSFTTSVTTPSLTNAGTLALSATGANVITAITNGSERLRIASDGTVLVEADSVNPNYSASPKVFIMGGATPLLLSNGNNSGTYFQINTGSANGTVNLIADARSGAYPPMVFTTNGSEQMRLNSTGLGIGTSSPSAKLSINSGANRQIYIGQNTSNSNYNAISLNGSLSDSGLMGLAGGGTGDETLYVMSQGNMVFRTVGTNERMRITSGGYLLLNTSTNYTSSSLQVYGNIDLVNTGTSQFVRFYDGTTFKGGLGTDNWVGGSSANLTLVSDGDTVFRTTGSATERMRIVGSSGNVGIGTSSPSSYGFLAVKKDQTADTAITVSNQGTAGATTTMSFVLSEAGTAQGWLRRYRDGTGATEIGFSDPLIFSGSVTGTKAERMRITSAGNVGLGTTGYSWGSYDTYGLRAIDIGAYGCISNENSSGGASIMANAYATTTSNFVYKGNYYATRYLQGDGTHQWYTAASGTAGNAITFSERMRIDNSGNVLIGNTNGTEKLTVTGKIKASDVLLGNNGSKGYGAITTTTSTSTPTGGSSGDHYYIY